MSTNNIVGSKVTSVKTWSEYDSTAVAAHNSETDVWMIIHGKVYDVSNFLEDHPGGPEIMQQHAGTDATADFEEVFHSPAARKQLADYCIGTLKGYTGDPNAALNSGKSTASTASGSTTTANKSNSSSSSNTTTIIFAAVAIIAIGLIANYAL